MPPTATGTAILFASSAGATAADDGMFAKAIERHLPAPKTSHVTVFKRIQEEIHGVSYGQQTPGYYDSIVGDFFFNGSPSAVTPPPPSKPEPETPVRKESYLNPKDGAVYVPLGPGRSRMGCPGEGAICDQDEFPAHDVEIARSFWIGQTKVTTGAFFKLMGRLPSRPPAPGAAPDQTASRPPSNPNMPVGYATYADATGYCSAIGGRLPTEAEWEYAMRAGDTGSQPEPLGDYAWYRDNSGNRTHPVQSKKPNAFGIYDFLGLEWEWVSDYFASYAAGEVRDPHGPVSGSRRVLRGGSIKNGPEHVRYSDRIGVDPATGSQDFGFRCVLTNVPSK